MSVGEHEKHLGEVLPGLRCYKPSANRGKCESYRQSVLLLRFVLSRERPAPDPQKVEALMHGEMPLTDRYQVTKFYSLAPYCRMFVPQFESTALPLTRLLRRDTPFT